MTCLPLSLLCRMMLTLISRLLADVMTHGYGRACTHWPEDAARGLYYASSMYRRKKWPSCSQPPT